MDGDTELGRLVEKVLGDPGAGEPDDALGQKLQQLIVSAERSGLAVGVPVRLADDLVHAPGLGPTRRDLLSTRTATVYQDHVLVLAAYLIERRADRVGVVDGLGAGNGDEGALGQVRLRLLVLSRAEEVAGIDRRGGELRGAADVRAMSRTPGVAGIGSVMFSRGIPKLLEGVAPIAEVAGALDDPLQLPGVDFGPVLRALQLFQLRREPVDGAVQSHGLHVQGVDKAPQQRFPLIGELGAVRRDLIDEGVEDRFQSRQRLVAVPDGTGIGLALLRCSSEAFEVLAEDGGRRDGLGVFECMHDELQGD